ncbi:hypothetical protein TSMEX_000935, partial [Taenia solium]
MTTAVGGVVEDRQGEIMDKIEEVAQRSEFVRKNQGWFCCGCHLFTLILAIVYVIGLVVCVVVYIMAAQQVAEVMGQPPSDENTVKDQVVAWLGNKSTYYNFPGTVSFVLQETLVLLNESSSSLIQSMNKMLDELKGQINATVEQGATVLLNEFQNVTGVNNVFNGTFNLSRRMSLAFPPVKIGTTAVVYPVGSNALQVIVTYFNDFATKLEVDTMPDHLVSQLTSNLNFTAPVGDLQGQLHGMLNKFKMEVEDVAKMVLRILAVEVCPYVYIEKGMNQSDYVLNSILAGKWPTIQQQQGEFLDIAPPRDTLYGLSVVCVPTDKTDPKLLPSVDIYRLTNLTKLTA